MLLNLISRQDTHINNDVVCLTGRNILSMQVEEYANRVYYLGLRRKNGNYCNLFSNIARLLEILTIIPQTKPDIVHCWTYIPIAVMLVVKVVNHKLRIICNIRHTLYKLREESLSTLASILICRILLHQCDALVFNSYIGQNSHGRYGIKKRFVSVIPNGFDTELFNPNACVQNLKEQYEIPKNSILIGNVARFHSIKGHKYLISAFAEVVNEFDNVYLFLVGKDQTEKNKKLVTWLDVYGLRHRVLLLGEVLRMECVMPCFDILVLSSIGEGFPNVVGEAMASGIPCIVTDVGDAKKIVASTGIVVKSRSTDSVKNGIIEMLQMKQVQRSEMGMEARKRIVNEYRLEDVIKAYTALYERLLFKTAQKKVKNNNG